MTSFLRAIDCWLDLVTSRLASPWLILRKKRRLFRLLQNQPEDRPDHDHGQPWMQQFITTDTGDLCLCEQICDFCYDVVTGAVDCTDDDYDWYEW